MKGKSKDPMMVSPTLIRVYQMLGFFYFFFMSFGYSCNQVSRQTVCLVLPEWRFRYYLVHSRRIFSFNTFTLWITQVAVKLLFPDAFSISNLYGVLYLVKSFTPAGHSCKMQVALIKHGRCAFHREARQLWAVMKKWHPIWNILTDDI